MRSLAGWATARPSEERVEGDENAPRERAASLKESTPASSSSGPRNRRADIATRSLATPSLTIAPGKPLPFGATVNSRGTQFAVFSRHATAVSLLLFDDPQDAIPVREIALDPETNRTGDVWHAQVDGAGPGTYYLFRVDGPYLPEKGHRFNKNKLLLDPYVKAVTGNFTWDFADARGFDPGWPDGEAAMSTTSDAAGMPKGIVIADDFDWQGDRPLNNPLRFSVIYETHVRGLTRHPVSLAAAYVKVHFSLRPSVAGAGPSFM